MIEVIWWLFIPSYLVGWFSYYTFVGGWLFGHVLVTFMCWVPATFIGCILRPIQYLHTNKDKEIF